MKNYLCFITAAVLGLGFNVLAGDVTGKITLKGTPPPETTIPFEDPTCGGLSHKVTTSRRYVVAPDGGLADVFVYISKGLEGKKFPVPSTPVEINQEGCMYYPYVSGVMVGQTLKFKNSDPLLHNVHAIPQVDGNNEFNFAEPSQGDVNDTKWKANITNAEVLVRINCDVHRWMICFVGVQNNPFFAVSGKDGTFKIPGLPAGKYTLTAYHLKATGGTPGVSKEITVTDKPLTVDFTLEVPAAK